MHECPHCGQMCDCSGDIDDCQVMNGEWVYENCTCCDDEEFEDECGEWEDD